MYFTLIKWSKKNNIYFTLIKWSKTLIKWSKKINKIIHRSFIQLERICYHLLIIQERYNLRERRNELLKETDSCLLHDVVIDENKLNAIKIYRQELRDFINKLLNDEIKCNIIDDKFEEKYFPKLILDGAST